MLKLEGKMMNGLRKLGINGEDMSEFLKLNSHVWDNNYVLDIRHSSIMVSTHVIPVLKLLVDLRLSIKPNLVRHQNKFKLFERGCIAELRRSKNADSSPLTLVSSFPFPIFSAFPHKSTCSLVQYPFQL